MNEFLTWDVLLTYGGCVAGTVLVTEWLKKIFSKVPTQIVSFVISVLILVVGHIATATFELGQIPLYLVNSIVVSLASNGGFDALKRTFIGKDQPGGELVIDEGDGEEGSTYISLDRTLDQYQNGEEILFRITKTSQK